METTERLNYLFKVVNSPSFSEGTRSSARQAITTELGIVPVSVDPSGLKQDAEKAEKAYRRTVQELHEFNCAESDRIAEASK